MLLSDDFAEHIYHVGSSHDLHSIIQSGLIPGEKSVKKERHAMFFTAVNPMFVDQHKEVEYDLTNPRIAVYKNHWKILQNTVYWCKWKVALKKEMQFYQTRTIVIILYTTLPAICIENVIYMKSREALRNKVFQFPRLQQKVVLKPNLYHGRQDSCNFEARTFVDIKAKIAKSAGKPVTIAVAAEELKSSGKPAAVT